MNKDLEMMKPRVFENNKVLSLTPEDKLEKWKNIIHKKALDGFKVRIYSDIETTGFAYWSRGRAIYDEVMDEKMIAKDSEKNFLEVEAIKNKDFIIDLKHPLCKSSFFSIRAPSEFAIIALGIEIIKNSNYYKEDEITEIVKNIDNSLDFYKTIFNNLDSNLKSELTINAKLKIKKIMYNSFNVLKKEALNLSKKVDRMIEYAFVTCYENQDGEVFLLKDDDGELIYLHEFIYPNDDGTLKKEQIIEEMPLIPYKIHKTDFDFLKGDTVHPFLNIKLQKKAPNAKDVIEKIIYFLSFDGNKEDQKTVSENLSMFFHNGNGFDVPFIDAEINKFFEDKKLRDYVQVYDTLKIAKAILPSDVQKFISNCQLNKNFGGDENIKLIENEAILPTSKSLDNIRRLAAFLNIFNPEKPKLIYEKAQERFFQMFKTHFESVNMDWKKYENMLDYSNNKNTDINLTKGFPKITKSSEKSDYALYLTRYGNYLEGRSEYIKSLNLLKKHENIYKNINNIRKNISENKFLSDALYRLNNADRSVHGARVDSQLFMDAFTVIENALYLKPKLSKKERYKVPLDLKIPENVMKKLEELKKGVN